MANRALDTNPVAGDRHITTSTSDWLWAVFALMLLSFLGVLLWNHSRNNRSRPFHQIPLIVLWVSTIAYFAMASDLGYTVIQAEFYGRPTRQVWWVRYIQWFINAPLILFALLSLTGALVSDILTTLFFSWALVICGLVGALTRTSYKWGFYAFGLFSLFYLLYRLFGHSRRYGFNRGYSGHNIGAAGANTAGTEGRGISGRFHSLAAWTTLIWLLYPLCWGLSEGSNTISPTSEMVFYGILDLMAGPVFFLMYIIMFRGMEYPKFGRSGVTPAAGSAMGAGAGTGVGTTAGAPVGGYTSNGAAGAPATNFGEKGVPVGANGHTHAADRV